MQNTPCSIEHGVLFAHLVAVFYGVFGAIRMPANPHEYWFFQTYLLDLIAACAAASLAIGTRKGEQET